MLFVCKEAHIAVPADLQYGLAQQTEGHSGHFITTDIGLQITGLIIFGKLVCKWLT